MTTVSELDEMILEFPRTRIYSVGLAALSSLVRLLIRLWHCSQPPSRHFVGNTFRRPSFRHYFLQIVGPIISTPSQGCSSPIDEVLLLLQILFASTDAGLSPPIGPSLLCRAQRTLQLALIISGHLRNVVRVFKLQQCLFYIEMEKWGNDADVIKLMMIDRALFLMLMSIVYCWVATRSASEFI